MDAEPSVASALCRQALETLEKSNIISIGDMYVSVHLLTRLIIRNLLEEQVHQASKLLIYLIRNEIRELAVLDYLSSWEDDDQDGLFHGTYDRWLNTTLRHLTMGDKHYYAIIGLDPDQEDEPTSFARSTFDRVKNAAQFLVLGDDEVRNMEARANWGTISDPTRHKFYYGHDDDSSYHYEYSDDREQVELWPGIDWENLRAFEVGPYFGLGPVLRRRDEPT
jgi:hypothetical protein